ncbi:hypothetical protein BDZ45DRAFT_673395 [Acephala macrosclerotiorum]|nr:hypothetical protein BDZ45DRAFT_673395 [Acephala macrosclerotiorum]
MQAEATRSDEITRAFDFSNFILECQNEVHDITYVINNTVSILASTPSNDTVTLLSTGRNVLGIGNTQFKTLSVAARTATIPDELTTNFATSLGQIFAAFSSDSFIDYPGILQQTRFSLLVARVPKAPLITLVILCFLMSLPGLLLGIVRLKSSPFVAHDVHNRLSVTGLIAAQFEDAEQVSSKASSMEDLFAGNREGRGMSELG